jgi:hypothetical protein
MWIRTQDSKALVNVNAVFIESPEIIMSLDDTPSVDIMGGYYTLGSYTKERAIEVLNDIQRQLVVGISYDTLYHGRRDIHQKVFNMPEK